MRRESAITLGLGHRIVEGLVEECTDVDASLELQYGHICPPMARYGYRWSDMPIRPDMTMPMNKLLCKKMHCSNCHKKLNLNQEGIVTCRSCLVDHCIKISGVTTNVPEFKINKILMLMFIAIGLLCTYFVRETTERGIFAAPTLSAIALSELVVAARSGYVSTRSSVVFRSTSPKTFFTYCCIYLVVFVFLATAAVNEASSA